MQQGKTHRGEVITFYSYKGGTGRTMALANVACVLAQTRKRVLIIDWDLEAPGLHHFLPLVDTGGQPVDGLLELFYQLHERTGEIRTRDDALRVLGELPFETYVFSTAMPGLAMLPAGRFNATYGARVNAFSWESLFNAAPPLLPAFAEFLSARYDYILVDSRTGITDVSGICTTILPSKLVVVFTPNKQSLTGIFELVRRATKYRRESNDWRPLAIFPLPSRIESTREQLMKEWRYGIDARPGYQKEFESLFREVYAIEKCDLTEYLNEVQVQHVADYAYGEQVAVMIETASRLSLKRSYEEFASRLQILETPWEDVRVVHASLEIEKRLEEVELAIGKRSTIDAWSILRGILETYRAYEQVEVAKLADELGLVGAALLEEGKTKEALEMLEAAAAVQVRESGEGAPETAKRFLALAKGFAVTAEWDDAYLAARKTLEILEMRDATADTVEALQLVAMVLARRGDTDASADLYHQAVEVAMDVFGEISEEVADAFLQWARQNALARAYSSAYDALRRARVIYERLGARLKLISVVREEARLRAFGGDDLKGADEMLQEVVKWQRELLGPRAPELTETLDELAGIAVEKKEFARARKLLEEVYFRLSTTRDRSEPMVIDTLRRIGYIAMLEGDFDVAYDRLESAMSIADSALDVMHPLASTTRLNLAELLVEKGNFREAEALARQALALTTSAQGTHSRVIALTLLAKTLRHQGMTEEARSRLEEARALLSRNDPQATVIDAELAALR
jgi:tetratricopeptide (TPR) repeat protein